MRLFHVSEEENISVFYPRIPEREDMDKSIGLVWATDEAHLPNFLTPRECPRVMYHISNDTTESDREKFFSSNTVSYGMVIENGWFDRMRSTTLYLYEFDTADFRLTDKTAGYYVSEKTQIPVNKYRIDDIFSELINRNVEIRITDNLWHIAESVKASSLNWSLCRMRNAKRLP